METEAEADVSFQHPGIGAKDRLRRARALR